MRQRQRAAAHARRHHDDGAFRADRAHRHVAPELVAVFACQRPQSLLLWRADRRVIVERARDRGDGNLGELGEFFESDHDLSTLIAITTGCYAQTPRRDTLQSYASL